MEAKRSEVVKGGRSLDSAYGVSFGIALGLILFIAGLVVSLTLGDGNAFGLVIGIPLLIAGLVVPLFMMSDIFGRNEINGQCPACEASIKASDSTVRLECPSCNHHLRVQDSKFYKVE